MRSIAVLLAAGRQISRLGACVVLSATLAAAEPATITVPSGVPLRVEVNHGYPLKVGTRVAAHLLEPVYVDNRLVVPRDATVLGSITATHPVRKRERADALLNGDFTPLRQAEVVFDELVLKNGQQLAIATRASERTADVVRFAGRKQSRSPVTLAEGQIKEKKSEWTRVFTAPEKMDRLRRFVYGQLPYHPQEIWAGTDFDAELTRPVAIASEQAGASLPSTQEQVQTPGGVLEARLTTGLTSSTNTKGTPVRAVTTKPLLDKEGTHVVLPEGTELTGTVLQAKPARSFGRNGTLRFTFRKITPPQGAVETAHGQVVGAEGVSGQNLSIDSEGGVKANAGPGRVLAPLVLGLLATKSLDQDGSQVAQGAVVSNGFGVVARVVGMAASDRNVAAGFAYYGLARSVYKRWIARGRDVEFARNTRLSIELSGR